MGKAASRNNALRHGLTARIALPGDTIGEIASHFWQVVETYRPVDAVAVNAMLELSICSWKFRRLFEQYAGHNAVNRLTVNEDRMAREKRLAQKWFRSLTQDARKALAHLETSFAGLSTIVECLENLSAELDQPEGSWTSTQFLLAVNLAGFDEHEIWDNLQLRSLWTAWYACRPGRKAALMESQSFLPGCPEYRTRARQAMEAAPLPAEGRRQLLDWIGQLRQAFVPRFEDQARIETELRELQPMAAGWPAPEETSQHLLHLRYSSQVDRKTRELHAIIAARPSRSGDDSWEFDENLLPSDWKSDLLSFRPSPPAHEVPEDPGSNVQEASPSSEMQLDILDEAIKNLVLEAFLAKIATTGDAPISASIERQPLDVSEGVPHSNDADESPPIDTLNQDEHDAGTGTAVSNPEFESICMSGCDKPAVPMPSEVETSSNRHETRGPDFEDSRIAPVPEVVDHQRKFIEAGENRSQARSHRKSRRKLRKDRAADVRNGRHLHATSKPPQPIEPRDE